MFSATMDTGIRRQMLFDLATRKFRLMYKKSWLARLWAFLTNRSARILELRAVEKAVKIRGRRYEGVRTVHVACIRGSENRVNDFDAEFHPLHSRDETRWVNVATAMLDDHAMPPVELIKVQDTYFVRDGHHRVSVAKALGQEEIDAVVTAWDVDESSDLKMMHCENFA